MRAACGDGRELARAPATRYNRGVSETAMALAPEPRPTVPPEVRVPLLERWASPRRERAALHSRKAAGALRGLPPVEQVGGSVAVVPDRCRPEEREPDGELDGGHRYWR